VNFIDVYFREGRHPASLPFVPGHEGAGEVVEIGPAVSGIKVGDPVGYTGIHGSYAQYTAVPHQRLVPIPAGFSYEDSASLLLQGLTAHYLTHSTYRLKKGETILLHAAAGGVGLLLVQMAKKLGARVIGSVSNAEKAQLALDAGADQMIIYTECDFEIETQKLTEGKGVDVVYDSVGKTTFEKGLNVLRPRGYMILFGASSGAVAPFDPMVLSQKGSLVLARPSLAHYIATADELNDRAAAVFGMARNNELRLRISQRYPLADARKAHEDLQNRKTTGKLLLLPF
jgi:NADPH2:quinone reductase